MPIPSQSTFDHMQKNTEKRVIRVAILAEEPLEWGSGKHFFPMILQGYTWTRGEKTYVMETRYIFDKDILEDRLTRDEFDVLLVPGGGVGDGLAMMKGFRMSRTVRKWKNNIQAFIRDGGGYIGICGGTALATTLQTAEKKPRTFLERQYHNSTLGITCMASYYPSLAFPLLYPFQKNHPEKIGAIAYVFSFAPGETTDGVRLHSGGVPIDMQICRDHPIFSDFLQDTLRIRWWGGPALMIPEKPDREVRILARYPPQDFSENKDLQIHAWRYVGGIQGLMGAFFNAARYIKKNKESLRNIFLYTFYLAGNWEITKKLIKLDYANKPCITTEIYPNANKARIVLCTVHPEYLVWWHGHIQEMENKPRTCLGDGLYQWKEIAPLSVDASVELTYTWWVARRFVAWAAKVPDDHLPPIDKEEHRRETSVLSHNVFWDGSLRNQMENI
ncbi:MAG: hypothetical protein BV459_07885, partial [Thermoplasmata archaeon M11B2D]